MFAFMLLNLRTGRNVRAPAALLQVRRRRAQRIRHVRGSHAAAGRALAVHVRAARQHVLRRARRGRLRRQRELLHGQVRVRHEHGCHLAGDGARDHRGRRGQQGRRQRGCEGRHRETWGGNSKGYDDGEEGFEQDLQLRVTRGGD